MSQITYNSIVLDFVKTDMIERTPNLSDDETEYKYTDWIITATFLYNPAATSYVMGQQKPGVMPPTTDTGIRHYLMQERFPLTYTSGGESILTIPALFEDGSTVDSNNGPIPQYCNIVRIAASRLFYVSYSIKCSVIECPDGLLTPAIASSRYSRSESVDVDRKYLSTLTTTGITYFRSDVLAVLGNNADFYRSAIIPPLLRGYRRKEIQYMLSSDGLKIDWATIDEEQIQDLGNYAENSQSASAVGIVKMGLTYRVSQLMKSNLGVASLGSICTVDTWCDTEKGSSRYGALIFLFTCALDKLSSILNIGILSSCDIMEDIFENHVEMRMSFTVLDDAAGYSGIALPIVGIIAATSPLSPDRPAVPYQDFTIASLPPLNGSNPNAPYSLGTRGSAAYQLAVNAFADACVRDASETTTINQDATGFSCDPTTGNQAPQIGKSCAVVRAYYSPATPGTGVPASIRQNTVTSEAQGTSKNIYLKYEIVSNNVTSKGISTLPKAVQGTLAGIFDCVNIQLFQPVSRKVVEFSIDRIGCPPDIPNPNPPDPPTGQQQNYTLLSAIVSPIGVEVMADGATQVYRVTGTYTYSMLVANDNNMVIPFDVPSWVNVSTNLGNEQQITKPNYVNNVKFPPPPIPPGGVPF